MTERQHRPNIAAVWSRSSVVSIEDMMYMGKIKFSSSPTAKGSGNGTYVYANVNFDEALTLANLILSNNFIKMFPSSGTSEFGGKTERILGKYTKFGGSPSSDKYGGRPEARILEITSMCEVINNELEASKARWKIQIRVGEGIRNENGTIKPKDMSNMANMTVYVSNFDMRKMMIMLDMHIRTYFEKYFEDMYDANDGKYSMSRRADVFLSKYRPAADNEVEGDYPTSNDIGAVDI